MRAKRTHSAKSAHFLSTPIEPPCELLTALIAHRYPDHQPTSQAVYEAARAWVPVVKLRKLFGLLERYGIDPRDPNCWLYLSMRLAEELHEGFRVELKKKRGRPRRTADCFDLFKAVEIERRIDGCAVAEACRRLSKAKHGKWRKKNPDSLEARYHEFKKGVADHAAAKPMGFHAFLIDAKTRAEPFSTTENP
jgi:hypothetical protein